MYIGDLHIHSRYSRATSKEGDLEHLDLWARKKGIRLVGTGDFTHPAWREELKEKLEPAQGGFYRLKDEYRISGGDGSSQEPRFVVTGEISSIYKKKDKVRKVHSVILLPSLEEGELISRKLETIGNIHSDGRPILGLDCRDLLEIVLMLSERAVYIPAHIWTPHFSLFGAFSGFDGIEECYEDLTPYIHALETGLSSDPPMNWQVSALDSYQLISNSDAHSPAKLGREANLFDGEFSYQGLYQAIQTGEGLYGTIEFFPEEGKYHFDGHRKCHVCLEPSQAEALEGRCPVCGRKLTTGVAHRVMQLSDREEGYVRRDGKPFESLVPLPEVIGACTGHAASGAKVQARYEDMLAKLGTEFDILRNVPVEDIKHAAGYTIGEGIKRLREGRVKRLPGFDGEYGVIRLFDPAELDEMEGQLNLFQMMGMAKCETAAAKEQKILSKKAVQAEADQSRQALGQDPFSGLNQRQREAVLSASPVTAVTAGPGTGKTRTLAARIGYLLETCRVKGGEITAVTFTNQAAKELKERIQREGAGKKNSVGKIQIGTFHSVCLHLLKSCGVQFHLAEETQTEELALELIDEWKLNLTPARLVRLISLRKTFPEEERGELRDKELKEEWFEPVYQAFQERMREKNALDFDDILLRTLRLFEEKRENGAKDPEWEKLLVPFRYLLVDEFQDINPVQYRLIQAWAKVGRELFVIGDPDQAIYGFRGANARGFERLEKDFPGTSRIRLEENYRCAGSVIRLAKGTIERNPGGQRILIPTKGEGGPVRLFQAKSEMGEAIFVAKEINRMVGGMDMLDAQAGLDAGERRKERGFSDIAVLYRTHRQAALLEACLKREGIPYIVTGREPYLMNPTVRGSVCFFWAMLNPEDTAAREISLRLLWNLRETEISQSVWEKMEEKYRPMMSRTKPEKVLREWMKDLDAEGKEDMQKLLATAMCQTSMEAWTEGIMSGKEGDLKRCGGKSYTADAVNLMTFHGAKGLEFEAVILFGLHKGILPMERKGEVEDEEEERRLLFVGITRAKNELILTTLADAESPFVAPLSGEGLVVEERQEKSRPEQGVQLSLFDMDWK